MNTIKLLKRVLTAGLLMVVLLTLPGCMRYDPGDSFMAPMAGYVAMGQDSTINVAFTCFYTDKPPFDIKKISNIQFVWPDDGIEVNQYAVEPLDTDPFDSYSVTLDLHAARQGQYRADTITVSLEDGTTLEYSTGEWFFDVGATEPKEELVDVWSSPAAASNGSRFSYVYAPAADVNIIAVQVGETQESRSESGLLNQGEILLDDQTPISYIAAKITAVYENKEYVYYGKGCYCGGMNISEDAFEQMRRTYRSSLMRNSHDKTVPGDAGAVLLQQEPFHIRTLVHVRRTACKKRALVSSFQLSRSPAASDCQRNPKPDITSHKNRFFG